jgi:hypothetical protein
MKPYVTAGVALVGASVIAVAPIAPRADLHIPAVNLAASIENPLTVFKPVVNATGDLIRETLQAEFADPFPILRQIFANQQFTVGKLVEAINNGGAAITDLVAGLPAALNAAGAILRTGDVNGAIDSLVSSGLQPILAFISGVSVPLQAALERPFAVGQKLVGAGFEVGLALTVALAQTFIGIGFPVGTTPILQNFVTVTESVLKSIATLNPINVVNALQNGVADVLLNAVTHISDFMTQSVPYIRSVIVGALKAGQPAAAAKPASVATAPSAAAATVTIAIPGADTPSDATVVTPVSNTDDSAGSVVEAPADAVQEPATVVVPEAEVEPNTETDTEAETETKTETKDAAEDDETAPKSEDKADAAPKSEGSADATDKAGKAESSSEKRHSDSSQSSDSESRAAA